MKRIKKSIKLLSIAETWEVVVFFGAFIGRRSNLSLINMVLCSVECEFSDQSGIKEHLKLSFTDAPCNLPKQHRHLLPYT